MYEPNVIECWRLIRKIKEAGWAVDVSTSASTSTIHSEEQAPEVTFPLSYREFLSEFGAIFVGESYVCGILKNDFSDKRPGAVLFETLRARMEFDLHRQYIVVGSDVNFDFCLDAFRLNGTEECPIMLFDRHTKMVGNTSKLTFMDFLCDFLNAYLKQEKRKK